ncbi:MAG: hypothetical protein QM680_02890 [Luteolibacter sp.]
MILAISHALACLALAVAAAGWMRRPSSGQSAYRLLMPFALFAGLIGAGILLRDISELFVAEYSGAIYEAGNRTEWIVGMAVWGLLLMLPLVGVVPKMGKQPRLMMVFGGLSLVASARMLLSL